MIRIVKRMGFFLAASVVFMAAMLLVFTVFYHFVEDLSWLDAFYFTVVTTRTIGFGDISPQTAAGKIGTILNALLPATVFLGASLVLLESLFNTLELYRKDLLMNRHKHHTIVIADVELVPSIVGEYLVDEEDFVIIGATPMKELPDAVLDSVNDANYLCADPTSDAAMQKARIDQARRILIATSDDTVNLMALVTAKGLNPEVKASVRVNDGGNEAKFQAVGADYALPTCQILGRMLSQAAVNPIAHGFLVNLSTHTRDPFLEEHGADSHAAGKPLRDFYPRAIALFRAGEYLYDVERESVQAGDVVLSIKLHFGNGDATAD